MQNEGGYAFDWGVMHLAEAGAEDAHRAEAAKRATSLDYVRRKFEAGQESRVHQELRMLEGSGGSDGQP
jgi:phosphosulfolactate synthase (CoM biosynthesis protein A)